MIISVRGIEFVECDFSVGGEYHFAHDISLIDFFQREIGHESDSSPRRWMAMLPAGVGLGRTADEAIESALSDQRANVMDSALGYWK